ncbi:MAG: SIR2 family protein [Oligoflexales bacterium]
MDCYIPGVSTLNGNHKIWKPPLVHEIFDTRFSQVQNNFPMCSGLVSEARFDSKEPGFNLESFMEEKWSSKIHEIRVQRLSLLLYLHGLFRRIGKLYFQKDSNPVSAYTFFLQKLIQKPNTDSIVLLNLNYDTFLDKAIENITSQQLDNVDNYLNINNKINYFKLHGCVNWGRKYLNGPSPNLPFSKVIQLISHTDWDSNLDDYIRVIEGNFGGEIKSHNKVSELLIPAMVLPLPSKYEFLMPKIHKDRLSCLSKDSEKIKLIVCGYGGKDKDANDLLQEIKSRIKEWYLVDFSDGKKIDGVGAAKSNLIPILGEPTREYSNGFNKISECINDLS